MSQQKSSIELVLVITTEADYLKAKNLARKILERKLAACVSLREIDSFFSWEGKKEELKEVELSIKSTKECLLSLKQLIKKFHSYDLPQWIEMPVSAGKEYGEWVSKSTQT